MDNNQFQRAMPGPPMPNLEGQKWVSPSHFNSTPGKDHEESSSAPEQRTRPKRGRPRQSRPAGASTGSPGSSHPGQPPNGRPSAPNAQPNSPQGTSFRPPRPPQPPQPPQAGNGHSSPRRPVHPNLVAERAPANSNKKKSSWRGLFFKLFLMYSAFLLIFTCPPTQPLTDDMPCFCSKLHNRIDDLRPFYLKHLAMYINPQLERPVVQRAKTTIVPLVQRAVDASSSFYDSRIHPQLESVASKIYAAAEAQAQPHLVKLQPHLAAVSSKAQEFKTKFFDPTYKMGLAYHEKYGKPALKRADSFVQTKVRPHVNQAASIGARYGQIYWAVFRKWFHEHVVLSVMRFYSQTVLPSIDKIRDRLNSRTENAAQDVGEISIESFVREASPEPTLSATLDEVVSLALDVEIGVPEPEPVIEESQITTFVEREIHPVEVHMPDAPEVPEVPETTGYDADQVASALDSAPEPPTKDIPEEAIEEYFEELAEEIEPEPVIEFNPPIVEHRETVENTETAETAETVEAMETVNTVGTADPSEIVETVDIVNTAETVETVNTVETADPAETVETADPAETVKTAEAVETTQPVEPVEPKEAKNEEENPSKEKTQRSWAVRVDRTARSALKNLQTDVDAACKEVLSESKPQFVKVLREISQYGESKVEELTKIVAEIENDETFYDDDDIVNDFTAAADHINDLSNDIREQALSVAEKALERTEELRKQTLEALDDFFDVILLEAGRKSVDDEEDEFVKWKEYHQLKEHLNSVRSEIEVHDIDMELINTSLREPQQAAILMAQGFMNHVNSLRAKTQFLVQQRLLQKRNAEEASKDEPESASVAEQEISGSDSLETVESGSEDIPIPDTTDEVVVSGTSPEAIYDTTAEGVEEDYVETVILTRIHTETVVREIETPEVVIQTVPIESNPEVDSFDSVTRTNLNVETAPEYIEPSESIVETAPVDTDPEEFEISYDATYTIPNVGNTAEYIEYSETTIQMASVETETEGVETPKTVNPKVSVHSSEYVATVTNTAEVETSSVPKVVIHTDPVVADSKEITEPEAIVQTVPIDINPEDTIPTTSPALEPDVAIQSEYNLNEKAAETELPVISSSSHDPEQVSSTEPIETLWEEKIPPFQYVGTEVEDPITIYETQMVTKVVYDDL